MALRRIVYRFLTLSACGSLPACTLNTGSMGGFASSRQQEPTSRFAIDVSTTKPTVRATTQFASMIRRPTEPGTTNEPLEVPSPSTSLANAAPGTTIALSQVKEPIGPRPPEVLPPEEVTPTPLLPPMMTSMNLEPPLLAAVRAHLAGRPELAEEQLRSLDKQNRELLIQLLPAVTKVAQVNISQTDPKESAVLADQFDKAASVFARRASLSIEKAIFCRSVKTFGHYDSVPYVDGVPAPFKAGDIYILYVEIGNVPCEPVEQNGSGGYSTRLACSLELRDAEGQLIELTDRSRRQVPSLSETKNDVSRSPIRDYFMLFWFAAPSRAGQYSVKFTVRDPAGGREISRRIPFKVQ